MATVRQPATVLTAEDLLALPDDGKRYELVEGELQEIAPASGPHGRDGGRIFGRLQQFTEQHDLGVMYLSDTGFQPGHDPVTVRCPDISFVRKSRLPETDEYGVVPFAPDFVVEVVSPSNTVNEMTRKVQEYLEAGTEIVWVVEQMRRQVTVCTTGPFAQIRRDGDTLDGGEVIPGFALPVTYIFDGTQATS
ncbi:MAG TPA: Uma2 family endonuclease [Thermomicrobiales bacterium]|nr:Uma2 family endonuclease [Thermomicrobiales bacterium]